MNLLDASKIVKKRLNEMKGMKQGKLLCFSKGDIVASISIYLSQLFHLCFNSKILIIFD